jgi:TolA-binding protein
MSVESSDESCDESALDPTAERVADFVTGQVGSPASSRSSANEFERRVADFRRGRRNRKRFAAGAAVTLALIVAGLAASRFKQGAPAVADLSYRVDGQEPPVGGDVLVPERAESLLAFSDGSKVRVAARSRGRVIAVNGHGARFALEDGKVSVDIVHRPRAQWTFEAGPFVVSVHGTSFTIAWNPADAVFELRLQTGAVSVASPLAGSEIGVRAGQTLRVSLRDLTSTVASTVTSTVTATAGGDGETAPSHAAGKLTDVPSPALEAPSTKRAGPPESTRWSYRAWTTALAENKAADVVADADRRGLATVLERADSEDLWALANAARYTGRFALARQALTAQRRRFPSSDRARDAAFLLGRLHDADPEGPENALDWYDRYLAEAPDGAHASDALGRKLTLLQRSNRSAEALAIARDYLHRFPRGTYATAARALVRAAPHQ